MTLPTLPLEIRQQIAACVETIHQPSLRDFSLTSKAGYAAAKFLIYRQVNITVHSREGLRRDADKLLEVLSHRDSTHHVKRIVVKGALQLDAKRLDSEGQNPWWIDYGLKEILETEEPMCYGGRHVVYDKAVIERFSEEDMAWAPVVSLLQSIPYLKDLIYDCQSQFPPSLLEALHEQHPHCRLHHLTFRFRTLLSIWGFPYSYETQLATSPSLYKVKVACSKRDTDGNDDFNLEAMMELATGLAPNLKEVIVLGLNPVLSNRYMRSRDVWRSLPGFTSRKPTGSLTNLSLRGFSSLRTPTLLQKWARHVDFSCLQQLTLGGCHDAITSGLTGETMDWLSQTQAFSKLRSLSIYLNRDDMYHERPRYSGAAVSFFHNLELLEELSVTGPIDPLILDAILSRHGQTLKKLSILPFEESFFNYENARVQRELPFEFSRNRLSQVQAECPALEELAIPIKRNKSSASEAEMYLCLAKMERLKVLFLTMDCSNWRITHDSTYSPQLDEGDEQLVDPTSPHISHLKRGVLKETFINCAVDETLARSIWWVMSKNKTGRRLERLKLWTTGGGDYGTGGGSSFINDLLSNLSRSWLIERVPREDQEGIIVRELGQREREARDASTKGRHETEPQKVFDEVWPCIKGNESWQDDWSSFPLQI